MWWWWGSRLRGRGSGGSQRSGECARGRRHGRHESGADRCLGAHAPTCDRRSGSRQPAQRLSAILPSRLRQHVTEERPLLDRVIERDMRVRNAVEPAPRHVALRRLAIVGAQQTHREPAHRQPHEATRHRTRQPPGRLAPPETSPSAIEARPRHDATPAEAAARSQSRRLPRRCFDARRAPDPSRRRRPPAEGPRPGLILRAKDSNSGKHAAQPLKIVYVARVDDVAA